MSAFTVDAQWNSDELELIAHLLWSHSLLLKKQIEDCRNAFAQARTHIEMDVSLEAEFRRRQELSETDALCDRVEKLLEKANANG